MTDIGEDRRKTQEILEAVDGLEETQEAIQEAVEKLTLDAQAVPVDGEVFDNVQTEYTSDPISAAGYRFFLLRIILTVTGSPGTLKINVQFSHQGSTYENYVRGPFGSLMYEDTGGNKSECIDGPVAADYMKINVVTTGTNAANKFTLTCKLHGYR